MLVTDRPPPEPSAPVLTEREMKIVFLMGSGHSGPEIAAVLNLSPRTVENRKRLIYAKLGVFSQAQAVAKALRLGLLQPGRIGTFVPHGLRQQHCEPGRPPLAVLLGPPSKALEGVAQILVAERVPLVVAAKPAALLDEYMLSWQRGPVVMILVDPRPEDWPAANALPVATVVVASQDAPARFADALARRACGLVTQADIDAGGLGPTLAAAAQGLLVVSRHFIDAVPRRLGPWPRQEAPNLTAREREILQLIASGHTVRQTARVLGIAPKTVENIQARLFRKLGARNRLEALTIADGFGLVERTPAMTS